jgi:hypothetical protein
MKAGLRAKNGLGAVTRVDKTPATRIRQGTTNMAAQQANREAGKMDFPTHERNYAGFIKLFKFSTVIVAIVALVVVLIIAN